MRLVKNKDEFIKNYKSAKIESKLSFGDDQVYLEKFFTHPKHIEIQKIADAHGNIYT